jgi:gamma-glutamyltranspeptidase / glutathione hydrolase
MFCLFYDAKTKKIHALNGSGRSTARLDLEGLRKELDMKPGESGGMHYLSVHGVTVPGAAAGWVDTVEKFGSGKLSLEQILTPAVELGEEGFPVSELCANIVCDARIICTPQN